MSVSEGFGKLLDAATSQRSSADVALLIAIMKGVDLKEPMKAWLEEAKRRKIESKKRRREWDRMRDERRAARWK